MARRAGGGGRTLPWLFGWSRSQMLLAGIILVLCQISSSRGDLMMGGHLDNKENQDRLGVPEHRSDDDSNLELELLGEGESFMDSNPRGKSPTENEEDKDEDSDESRFVPPRYRVLPYAFNGGHPFSLEKDPITGKIDFEKAPPLKALEYSVKSLEKEYEDKDKEEETTPNLETNKNTPVGANEINPYSPSFHDFLNLPVRYTYEKSPEKYPLISSSYANTKVQSGPNSYNTYNHKKYDEVIDNFYIQTSISKSSSKRTSTRAPTTSTTTTTSAPTISMSTERTYEKPTVVTTWKPQSDISNGYRTEEDYEGTLPIERLRPSISVQKTTTTTTEKSRYSAPPARVEHVESTEPNREDALDEYELYEDEDYDRIVQMADKPHPDSNSHSHDYYNGMDGIVDTERKTTPAPQNKTTTMMTTSTTTTTTTTSTARPFVSSTRRNPEPEVPERRVESTTAWSTTEAEKRVTSMPIDTIGDSFEITNGNNNNINKGTIVGTMDNNKIPNKNTFHESVPDNYYGRIPMGPTGGIVLQSTSNVLVPPGQDTVSFVLGNRQSVSEAGNNFYAVEAPAIRRPTPLGSGNTGSLDNYSGEMIVSAGIGVGSDSRKPPIPYGPSSPNLNRFEPASLGMPTVDIVSPGNPESTPDTGSGDSLDNFIKKWWGSASSTKDEQVVHGEEGPTRQQPPQQFDHRVVFPEDQRQEETSSGDNGANQKRPIEEHVIVFHEIPHSPQQSSPSTSFHFETTTQRFSIVDNSDDKPLPQLSESLTPPAAVAADRPNLPLPIQRPPSYNFYHHHHQPSPGNEFQRLPQRLPTSNGFKRRPSTSVENNLPNILPQFRPNAKTSHGHNRAETIGTIPAGAAGVPYGNGRIRRPPVLHHRPPTSRRPSGPAPHLQRLNPPPVPAPPPPPPISSLRLPTAAPLVASSPQQQSPLHNRLHRVSIGAPPAALPIDERHHHHRIKSRLEDDTLERFSAEPPARPPYFTNKERTNNGERLPDGVPRIATLQMIHAGVRDDGSIGASNNPLPSLHREQTHLDGEQPEREEEEDGVKNDEKLGSVDPPPVYIVYPVKGALDIRAPINEDGEDEQDDASVVLGTYGSQRPLPPETLLQDSHDSGPILTSTDLGGANLGKKGSPSIVEFSPGLTESASSPQLASDFPYPLERPDPSMFTSELREKPLLVPSEHHNNNPEELDSLDSKTPDDPAAYDIERDASVNVIPYLQDHVPFRLKEKPGLISATLDRSSATSSSSSSAFSSIVATSSTPIAYVYTPTTVRVPLRHRQDDPYGSVERGPVLLPSQQPSSSSSSAPSPQSFMAPFVASASAEAPSNDGWSVLMPDHQQPSTEDSTNNQKRRQDPPESQDKSNNRETDESTTENDPSTNEKNKIDHRNDSAAVETSDNQDTRTEKPDFDVENFTPQLYGGFQPIFPVNADSIIEDKSDSGSIVERPRSETG